jgi:fumarate reductase flavoprotein subunit
MAVRPASEARFEYSVPVLLIGAGACGLTAALSARETGAEVLVLERDPRPSGSTSLSAGLIPAAGSRFQRDKGIEDSPESFAADLAAKAHGENDPAIVRAVAEASGPTVDWLADVQGLDLHLVEGFTYPGHSHLRMHGPRTQTGADLQAMLLSAADRAGIDILTGASVQDLYADEHGRVVAVGARRPDGRMESVGCEAVVLACSGFGGNPDFVRRHIPEMGEAEYCGHTSNTGDALEWGLALGAAVADLGAYQGHGSVPRPHSAPLTWAVITLGGIQVNAEGKRFANEMRGYSEHAQEVLSQPGRFAWDIYDARCEAPALAFHDYREFKRLGVIKEAATVPELAAVTGLPEEALAATLRDAEACAAGTARDPFGRDFTPNQPLASPYRAAKITGALFHTQGGLAIDEQARVLRRDGSPLPNLFAGGGAARGLSGPSSWGYLSGNGLLSAVVLGRIAGLAAARLAAGGRC